MTRHHKHSHKNQNTDSQKLNQNEGEGSRTAAREYNAGVQSFIADDKVEPAAREAKDYVEHHPTEAEREEMAGKAGPRPIARRVEDLIIEGRAMVDRAVSRVRRVRSKIAKRRATR
jgi:hypothetical protein